MSDGLIDARQLVEAARIYLRIAYPGGVPEGVQARLAPMAALGAGERVPAGMLEVVSKGEGDEPRRWALRLGQPMYPHMKLMVEEAPGGVLLLRADAHDSHLHAPAGSPDAAWLAGIRASNKELTEKIEGAWVAAGLPTFRDYLRKELERRKRERAGGG